jgi:hypothetical protein
MTTSASGTPAQPTAATMRRLAFVRMFFQQGIGQSRQSEPLNLTALLSMHDTAELFLQVAADHLGAKLTPFVHFMEYFKLLAPPKHPGGVKLHGQREMDNLNSLRNGFKHRGQLPSTTALDQACTDVRTFLASNTALVFGIVFADIDMAEVIPQAGIRDKVRAATAAASGGDIPEGMGLLAEAHDDLFGFTPGPPSDRPIGRFGNTIRTMAEYDIAAALRPAPDDHSRRPASADHRTLASVIANTVSATREMQRAMRIMALGIDYREFERFKQLTPAIVYFISAGSERRSLPNYAPTIADFEFCRQFIITAALRIAEQP